MTKPIKVLFVCLGNICRSPTAEAVYRKIFESKKINILFDSAGTADYHVGEKSDPRSIKHAEARGYKMTHLARQVTIQDFHDFDFIFAMDKSNLENLKRLCPDSALLKKIHLLIENDEVPDPYYKDVSLFEKVLDLIENSVEHTSSKFL